MPLAILLQKKKKSAPISNSICLDFIPYYFPFNFSAFDVLFNIYSLQQLYVVTLLKKYL